MKNAFEQLEELSREHVYDRRKEINDICDKLKISPMESSDILFVLQPPSFRDDDHFRVVFYSQCILIDPISHQEFVLKSPLRFIKKEELTLYFSYTKEEVDMRLCAKYKIADVTVDNMESSRIFFVGTILEDIGKRVWSYYKEQVNLLKYQLTTFLS